MNELSIIIPCPTATDTLWGFIERLVSLFMNNPADVDVIIVANEDIHIDQRQLKAVRQRFPWLKLNVLMRHGHHAYGALIRFGMAYSLSRYVAIVSPYGGDDITLLSPMLSKIRKGVQLVQATRLPQDMDAQAYPLRFRWYQRIYRLLSRWMLGQDTQDSTYGFKMVDRVFIQSLGLTLNGYSISPEITYKTLLAGGKVVYLSSHLQQAPLNKDFKLYREGLGFVWVLLRGFCHRLGMLWF